MSTIKISLGTQPLDFDYVLGRISLDLTFNGQTQTIYEDAKLVSGGYTSFQIIPWVSPNVDREQALELRNAIIRDWAFVGVPPSEGPSLGNLKAYVDENDDIIITARVGTFSNASYSGTALNGVSFVIDNSVQEEPKSFTFTAESTGTCGNPSTRDYVARAASGGIPPYRLTLNGVDLLTGWDGNSDEPVSLERGKQYAGYLFDSSDTIIKSVSLKPPRLLASGDFSIDQLRTSSYSDITIRSIATVLGTTPLEYALGDSEGQITDWQSSNLFPGRLPGLYILYVRDRFGCSISKQFEVLDITSPDGQIEAIRYFEVSNFNSLSFLEKKDFSFSIRPNFYNTLSQEEKVGKPYQAVFRFPSTSVIQTQFKSSYPIHVCTLLKSDGTKQSLPLQKIQSNIGTQEKVDCRVVPLGVLGTGVYFEGGNRYTPNSTSVDPENGSSPYSGGLPPWANNGVPVVVEGLGTHLIEETDLYDEVRGSFYFRIAATASSETVSKIQVTYNRHPYDLFRMDFSMSLVPDHAKVIIEAGWGFDQIERRFDSEVFALLPSPEGYLKIEWSSRFNLGSMVFTDGIKCEMWIRGRIRPYPIGESRTKDLDDRTRSLKQSYSLGQRLYIPLMTPKQWDKLSLASGIADRGEFKIEGMQLILISPIEFDEELGDTNLSSVTAEYKSGGNSLVEMQDEIVTVPSTGQEGTAQTGTDPIVDPELRLLRTSEGNYIITKSGKYISLIPD